jgi:hypothetical protein
MADLPRNPDSDSDTGDDTRARPDRRSSTGTPRWVTVVGIIVVVLLVVVMMVAGGAHGLGRHTPSGDAGTPLASVPEGHTPPTDAHTQPS